MLKKPQSVVAVLVLSAVVLLCAWNGPALESQRTVGHAATVAGHDALPRLAESTVTRLPDPAAGQTDNVVLPLTSGGAVAASFTVIASAGGCTVESMTPLTAGADDGLGVAFTAPMDEEAGGGGIDRQVEHSDSDTAVGVAPKSGRLSLGWALMTGALVVGDMVLIVLAIRYGWAGRRSPVQKAADDTSCQLAFRELGEQAK